MIMLVPITAQNIALFKAVRLRALQDTPLAFGSTYDREIQLTGAEWRERANRWNGQRGVGYLALDDGSACGIAGSLLDPEDETRAQLISMWTAPTHRRRGIGRMLVNRVAAWAHHHGALSLSLMVTSANESALLFYHRLGFIRTGRTEPYPNDPALSEYEMLRPLP